MQFVRRWFTLTVDALGAGGWRVSSFPAPDKSPCDSCSRAMENGGRCRKEPRHRSVGCYQYSYMNNEPRFTCRLCGKTKLMDQLAHNDICSDCWSELMDDD